VAANKGLFISSSLISYPMALDGDVGWRASRKALGPKGTRAGARGPGAIVLVSILNAIYREFLRTSLSRAKAAAKESRW
jgi:hypothetical protein